MTTTTHRAKASPGRRGNSAMGAPILDDRAAIQRRRVDIERVSPEGSPGDPEVGSLGIGLLILGSIVLSLLLGVVVAVFAGFAAGLVVVAFGLGLSILFNPEIWSASLRAQERHQIELDEAEEDAEAMRGRR
ncbi:MAG: hypothetical protein R3B57_03455 [Phycisphaerales bacterium]